MPMILLVSISRTRQSYDEAVPITVRRAVK